MNANAIKTNGFANPIQDTASFRVKDRMSALTHFIGLIMAVIGMPVLLIRIAEKGAGIYEMASYGIFNLSMVALYAASTAYHSFVLSTPAANKRLKKLDHMMIFILIAGTYTPICVAMLPGEKGMPLLAAVWAFAAAGILFKAFWVTCPKWVSSVIYICMGWLCVFVLPEMHDVLRHEAFMWLLRGGIFYTVGGVIYALKLPALSRISPEFGAHELFHVFVMAGSFCHYMTMFVQ